MKKVVKFCAIAVIIIVIAGLLLSKELLEDVGEGAGKLVTDVVKGYEGFEGYDIEDSTMFDRNQTVESGDLEREFQNLTAVRLDIELGGCELEIQPSENENVYITTENIGKFQAYQEEKELKIKATRKAKEDTQAVSTWCWDR